MNRSIALVLAGLVVVSLGAFVVVRSLPPDSYQWQRFESPDRSFSINLPGKPVDGPTPDTTVGALVVHSVNARASADAAYGCTWWDDPSLNPQSLDAALDGARDRGLAGVQGQLVSEQKITVQGYPGRDVHGSARGNMTYEDRLVVVGTRIYSLLVMERSGKHDGANIQKFHDSFTPR